LDGYRILEAEEKVPAHQRVSRTLVAERTPETVTRSAEGGADTRSRLNFDDPSCAVVVIGKTGDAIGRARWGSSFVGHPGAEFFRGKQKSAQVEEKEPF
jgi:hypothetical protein